MASLTAVGMPTRVIRSLQSLTSHFNRSYSRQLSRQLSTIVYRSGPTLSPLQSLKQHIACYSTDDQINKVAESSANQNDVLYKTIIVEASAHDPAVLKSYEYFASTAAKHLNITVEKSYTPPKVIERTTLPKSRHVYGKYHKVQYERRTHYRVLELKRLTGSTADTYLEYIQRNLPEGVAMKVTKVRLEVIPDHIRSMPVTKNN